MHGVAFLIYSMSTTFETIQKTENEASVRLKQAQDDAAQAIRDAEMMDAKNDESIQDDISSDLETLIHDADMTIRGYSETIKKRTEDELKKLDVVVANNKQSTQKVIEDAITDYISNAKGI